MEVTLTIPPYSAERGFQYHWEPGFEISAQLEGDAVVISANKAGLISLANHLLNLAQESVPEGCHLHLDEHNSLDEHSLELIIQKSV